MSRPVSPSWLAASPAARTPRRARPATGAPAIHAFSSPAVSRLALIALLSLLWATPGTAQSIVSVSTVPQLQNAVAALTSNTAIVLAPGIYTLGTTLTVTGPLSDVTIRGATGNRDDVVIVGPGMNVAADTWHGIRTTGTVTRPTVSDLTIMETPGSALSFGAGASSPVVRNVRLANSGRTFIDMPDSLSGPATGIVEYSLIEFVAPAIAKTRQPAGINIKGGSNWIVRWNTFRRIWANDTGPASAAVLANFSSSGTLVEGNTIVDCQVGIGLGATDVAGRPEHVGGVVRNNIIFRSGQLQGTGTGGDVGILVADSAGTRVAHNTVFLGGTYPNAIEYRYPGSANVVVRNNLTDKAITARDGAVATLSGNSTSATAAMFVNPTIANPDIAALDLHLRSTATAAINAGASIVADDGPQDLDGQVRPTGSAPDIGADEYAGTGPTITTQTPLPAAPLGNEYYAQVQSSLFDPAWTLVAGQLPPGTNSQLGVTMFYVFGTPTAVGTYSFRLRATDLFNGAYAERTFTIQVTWVPQTVTSSVSLICGTAYTAPPYPLYSRTFTYTVPAGYDITNATLGGTWGNDCYTRSTAAVDIRLAGTVVKQCKYQEAGCWLDQAAELPPRPWNAALPTALVGQLATGSALMEVQQTSETVVELGGTTLTLTVEPRLVVPITVTSNPPGATITVDGSPYTTPRMFAWVAGSTHTIEAPTPQGTSGSRLVFASWRDGGAASRTITVPAAATTYTADFTTQYLLTLTVSPSGGGTVARAPAATDGYYASGTQVQLTATPSAGYAFAGWTGAITGTANPASVTMTVPRSVTATFVQQVGPAITGVAPATGPLAGGTAIVVSGSGFGSGAGVTVGGVAATNVTVVNAATITAITPAAAVAGARDVAVTTGGGVATRVGGFTYIADVVSDETRSESGVPVPRGTGFLQPALSGDGRYLAYVVTSDAMVMGDTNGAPDVVVRDRVTGKVVRVSVAGDGTQANGPSGRPRISESGRYVAFWSEASTLVAGDTNGVRDVFLHDRDADGNGVFDETAVGARTTTRVSVATSGAQGDAASAPDGEPLVAGVASDGQLDLSPDGLWVAFRSAASTLVPGDTNGVTDIFLRSVAGQQTTRVSVAQNGTEADGASQSPAVSAGAQRLVFASRATNLVAGTTDANGVPDVFVVERASGQVVRLSEPAPGADANGASDAPAIDDAGRIVAFATLAKNLVPALAGSTTSQIVVITLPASKSAAQSQGPVVPGAVFAPLIDVTEILKQLASGALPPGTATVQPGDDNSGQPEVCGNGTCVAYTTESDNLTPEDPDTNDARDAMIQPVVPTPPPAPPPPLRVSRDSRGNQATAPTDRVAVGGDGTIVAMQSTAPLTPDAAASNPDADNVFVRAVPLVLATISRTSARIDVSETVELTGAGFQNGATVLFGTVGVAGAVSDQGRKLTVASPTTATQPALAPGVVALTVRNPDGSTVPVFQGFTFLAPPGPIPTTDTDADGLPDDWEIAVGLNPRAAAGADGRTGDPDNDGLTNEQEFAQKTHPRANFVRYLAEGATRTPAMTFTTTLGLANASATQTAHTWLRFQKSDGTQVPWGVVIPPRQARTVVANTIPGLEAAEFSTVIESDEPVAVHRLMTWDAVRGYGSHLEAAVLAPAPQWFLAEGSTKGGFQLFYLIQNPEATAAQVEVRFLLPSGAPVVKTYTVGARSRFNVWVNTIPELASTDCSAVVTSTTGVPIIVERAMYLDGAGLLFGAGHESAGVTAPAETWFLAEGATGPYFDLFVLVANPNDTAAELEATYLLPNGSTVVKAYTVAANSRFNIWVDYDDARLADTAVSTLIRSTNGVPVLVERAMWWPQTPGWWEAHDAFGATQPGTLWALGSGEVSGPPISAATYVLVANTSVWEAAVRVSVLFEDGTAAATRTFLVNPTSRFNVDVGVEFPQVLGKRFGVVIESVPTATNAAAQIVVEGARYHNDTAGVVWAAGADALATRLR